MASMSKLALWCALLLMFTFTILVYMSPYKPSTQTTVLQKQADIITPQVQAVQVKSGNQNQVRDQSEESIHRHVSIASVKEKELVIEPQQQQHQQQHHQREEAAADAARRAYEDEEVFLRAQKEVQKHRRYIMDRVCQKYHPNPEADMVKHPPWNILVDDKYKLVYCFVQKVACTNWKKVLLVLSGQYNTTESIPQFFTNRQGAKMLKSLSSYPEVDRRRILRTYTKFMFARHPFSRVLSAYRNKLAPDSTFQRASKWQRKIGTKIISKFRPNAEENVSSAKNFNQTNYDLSFDEFVKFILNPRGSKNGNKHWRDLHVSCLPCLIHYDVIGKIETLEDDARYILTLSGAKDTVKFPSAEGSSPTNSSDPYLIQKYFADLPHKDITDLYNRYLIDFLMFDYHATVDGVLDVR